MKSRKIKKFVPSLVEYMSVSVIEAGTTVKVPC
jgi:hypothetical protein